MTTQPDNTSGLLDLADSFAKIVELAAGQRTLLEEAGFKPEDASRAAATFYEELIKAMMSNNKTRRKK